MCSFLGDFPSRRVVFCPSCQELLQWLVYVFVLHVCMSSMEVGIIKFSSQGKQAQLHSGHMHTFIIEQQALNILTSGFPYTQQISLHECVYQTLTY